MVAPAWANNATVVEPAKTLPGGVIRGVVVAGTYGRYFWARYASICVRSESVTARS